MACVLGILVHVDCWHALYSIILLPHTWLLSSTPSSNSDHCFDVCLDFTFFGPGVNAGPPPECRIADCLLCDEQMSGPIFQEVAARSRRRSGLLSKIARPCNVILIVNHTNPCDFVKEQLGVATVSPTTRGRRLSEHQVDAMGSTSSLNALEPPKHFTGRSLIYSTQDGPNPVQPPPAPYKWAPPTYNETCFYMKETMGLLRYQGSESNNWLPELFLSQDQKDATSQYTTCYSYQFRNVFEGFWYNMSNILGGMYEAAKAFAIIATTLGGLSLVFVWTTTCIAYPTRFWSYIAGIFGFCGLCTLLTLLFFGSGVCSGPDAQGCGFGKGAATAIVAAIFWFISTWFAFSTGPYKAEQQTAACCCCPSTTVSGTGADPSAYAPVPTKEPTTTEVSVVETEKSDGTIVVKKTTTFPNGAKSIEVTTKSKKSEK